MDTPTHYELLCVTPDATADDIRAAYRRLIRMYHPDVAGSAGVAMTLRLNDAQSALLDPAIRAQYDRQRQQQSQYATAGSRSSYTADRPSPAPRYTPPTQPAQSQHAQPQPAQSRPAQSGPSQSRVWTSITIGAVVTIIAATIVVFAYSYAGPLDLTTPRVIPPIVIALAWIVASTRRAPRIFVAVLFVSAAVWPLSLFGVAPVSFITDAVSPVILALLSVTVVAVVALRLSAPRMSVSGRNRTAAA